MTNYAGTITIEPKWDAGERYKAKGQYTIGATVDTADTFTFTDILPENGTQVESVTFYGAEFDTNAAPTATMIIGDGTDTDAYLTSKTAGAAGAQLIYMGDGVGIGAVEQASRDIVVTVGGTLATAATSGTFWVEVEYYCDNFPR